MNLNLNKESKALLETLIGYELMRVKDARDYVRDPSYLSHLESIFGMPLSHLIFNLENLIKQLNELNCGTQNDR